MAFKHGGGTEYRKLYHALHIVSEKIQDNWTDDNYTFQWHNIWSHNAF